MKSFYVRARRPEKDHERGGQRHWMTVGMATELDDGNILMTLNALPFHFDGELKLVVDDGKPRRKPDE